MTWTDSGADWCLLNLSFTHLHSVPSIMSPAGSLGGLKFSYRRCLLVNADFFFIPLEIQMHALRIKYDFYALLHVAVNCHIPGWNVWNGWFSINFCRPVFFFSKIIPYSISFWEILINCFLALICWPRRPQLVSREAWGKCTWKSSNLLFEPRCVTVQCVAAVVARQHEVSACYFRKYVPQRVP